MRVFMRAHILLKTCKLMKIRCDMPTFAHEFTVTITHAKHTPIKVVPLQIMAFDESQH